jgi:hypothetical protein
MLDALPGSGEAINVSELKGSEQQDPFPQHFLAIRKLIVKRKSNFALINSFFV